MKSMEIKEPPKDGSMDDYEAKDAFQTLMKAHSLKKDKEMMKRVHKHAVMHKEMMDSMGMEMPEDESVTDMKSLKAKAKKRREELQSG